MELRKNFVHGKLLKNKSKTDSSLEIVYNAYQEFIERISSFRIINKENIELFMQAFNYYRNKVLYIIEDRKNSGQEILRSSMLEELFCHLFSDLILDILKIIPPNLYLGKANSYVDLTFSPASFKDIFDKPNPFVHSKDQDFVLGGSLQLTIKTTNGHSFNEHIIIPVIAIECKTYIERNMLDSCAGTARRIKKAMPYCLYIVAAEYIKLKDEQPELSDINEIYILCKATNAERLDYRKRSLAPHQIQTDLIIDLFYKTKGHLQSIWWSPENALTTGKVINRP